MELLKYIKVKKLSKLLIGMFKIINNIWKVDKNNLFIIGDQKKVICNFEKKWD